MATVRERVDTLEDVLHDLIIHTEAMQKKVDMALIQLETNIDKLSKEAEKSRISLEANIDNLSKKIAKLSEEMDKFRSDGEKYRIDSENFRAKIDKFGEEMRADRREMNKQWGALANKMGTLDEDLVSPAVRPVLSKYFNCDPIAKTIRYRKRVGSESFEVDVLAVCEDKVFMIEVRSSPRIEYVNEILKKAAQFKKYFPEYKDKELISIFASIVFNEDVIDYASKKGLYVMAYREWDYMDILNFDECKNVN